MTRSDRARFTRKASDQLKSAATRSAGALAGPVLTRQDIEVALLDAINAATTVGLPTQGVGETRVPTEREPYKEVGDGLFHEKPTNNGPVQQQLTNFTARIVSDTSLDDGTETRRQFEIAANLRGKSKRFTIPASQFQGMSWVTEHLGAEAILFPGLATKDHARCAIQHLSGSIPHQQVYTHTGWRLIDGVAYYLHANGAIGPEGAAEGIQVSLPDALGGYELHMPDSRQDLIDAVRASLAFLELAPDEVSIPAYALIWRAALGGSDFSVHIAGPTGTGKSAMAALCQQHWGPTFDAEHLPASWSSTANANEGIAFVAKDAVLVIDDFAPTGNIADVQRAHRDADRLFRSQGNRSGRSRMKADGGLRLAKPPRGLIISTGEDVPRGQSLQARIVVLEVSPGHMHWESLTRCQEQASRGLYSRAMAGFVLGIASTYGPVQEVVRRLGCDLRAAASHSQSHRRTPHNVAELAVGFSCFLAFATDIGAIAADEADALWERGWLALGACAGSQSKHQISSEPTRQFLELMSSALASGQAHLAAPDGNAPPDPEAWGWRVSRGGNNLGPCEEWKPQGDRIGWIEDENLFLESAASFRVAQKQGRDGGEGLSISQRTLSQRLHEKGFLVSTEPSRSTKTIRRTLGGRRQKVLHLDAAVLTKGPRQTDQPDQPQFNTPPDRGTWPCSWSVSLPTRQEADQSITPPDTEDYASPGQVGQFGQVPEQETSARSGDPRENPRPTPDDGAST